MLGERQGMGEELFVACSLRDLIPEDYVLDKGNSGTFTLFLIQKTPI